MTKSTTGPTAESSATPAARGPLMREAAPALTSSPASVTPPRQPHSRPASDIEAQQPPAPAPAPAASRRRWLALALISGGLLLLTLFIAEVLGLIRTLADWHWALALPLALLAGAFALCCLLAAGREILRSRRLAALGELRVRGETLAASDAAGGAEAESYLRELSALYRGRPPAETALQTAGERLEPHHSGAEQVAVLSAALGGTLDRQAVAIVAATMRRVGVIAAINPLAVLDALLVLWLSLRMLRQIAAVYGGRPGLLGSWRLAREVVFAVTGAGAAELAGDAAVDLAGAGVAGIVSAKLGQGVLVALLLARVGLCAVRLCRPVPLGAEDEALWRRLRRQALRGSESTPEAD